jgi:aspartyl-tRNA(Asn)/glutamyl-tRNA(Gln) amidotransferase subunit C
VRRLEANEVEEIAVLARLALSAAEIERLRGELGAILTYVEQLRGLDTTGVEPMTHAVPMACPLREDVAGPSLPVEEALGQAPARDEDFFEVPHILSGAR